MKIAIINDTHSGIKNSSDIFIDYQKRFFEEIFFPYLVENNIKQIIHLGDFYDNRKYINFKSLNATRKHFLDNLRKHCIIMDIIPGNHDVFYKSTNNLCSLNELLGYYTNEVNIVDKPTVLNYDGVKIGLLPWINSENYDSSLEFIVKSDATILAAHLELNGFDSIKDVKNTHGMSSDIFKKYDQVWTGHFHTKSSQDNIHYFGSQMEFTWADCDDPKYFHIYDTETNEVKPIRNPITKFKKIYYDDEMNDYKDFNFESIKDKFIKVIIVSKNDTNLFDIFMAKMYEAQAHEIKIVETFDEFNSEHIVDNEYISQDTEMLLVQYINDSSTEDIKDDVIKQIKEIYSEANDVENI